MATRRDWKKRRKRQLKRRLIKAGVLIVMAVILFGVVFGIVNIFQKISGTEKVTEKKDEKKQEQVTQTKKPDKKEEKKKLKSKTPQKYTRMEAIGAIRNMAEEVPEMADVADRASEYPDELLVMLANNPETLEFVQKYPEKKMSGCTVETIGKIKKGEIPLLLQWDERWGYASYGDSNIAVSGCGPTALAMVAAGLKQDAAITPYAVAKEAEEQGHYTEVGTSWDLMSEGCKTYGIQGNVMSLNENKIKEQLEEGHPIICSMREGDFTTEGHYIVLIGLKGDKIKIHDPNSITRSEKLWTYEELEGQIKNLWWYTTV